jgi:hypothetical protein
MDSELSESAVSPETVNRRMPSDMSGPLNDVPDGTTIRGQVATPDYQQENVLIRSPFLFQVSVMPVPGLVAGVLPWRSDSPNKG